MSDQAGPPSPCTEVWMVAKEMRKADITECPRLGNLNDGRSFSHSSGDQKSRIRRLLGLVSLEIFLLGFQVAAF